MAMRLQLVEGIELEAHRHPPASQPTSAGYPRRVAGPGPHRAMGKPRPKQLPVCSGTRAGHISDLALRCGAGPAPRTAGDVGGRCSVRTWTSDREAVPSGRFSLPVAVPAVRPKGSAMTATEVPAAWSAAVAVI